MADYNILLNGTTGLITVPNNGTLNPGSGSISFSFWMNTSDTSAIILDKGINSSGLGYRIGINSSILSLQVEGTLDSAIIPVTGSILGSWHHVVFSYDSSGTCLPYLDASVQTGVDVSIVGDIDNVLASLIIGSGPPAKLNGSIDDLRIYKGIVLNQTQIDTIYAEGIGKKYAVGDAGAGLAFNFDEGTGTTTQSVGTATLTGTFTGGVSWQSGGVPFPQGVNSIASPESNESWSW